MNGPTTRDYHKRLNSPSPGFDAYMERAMQAQFEWHWIFAFRPVVTINGERVWFRVVMRRFQKKWVNELDAYRPVFPRVAECRRMGERHG